MASEITMTNKFDGDDKDAESSDDVTINGLGEPPIANLDADVKHREWLRAKKSRLPIDPAVLASIVAEIVRGLSLEQSRYKDEPGVTAMWDRLAREVAEIQARGDEVEVPKEWFGYPPDDETP
jgi:hypothetical protein